MLLFNLQINFIILEINILNYINILNNKKNKKRLIKSVYVIQEYIKISF